MPYDWQIIMTDIAGSTRAIENGRYREVNLIRGATIAAICNLDPNFEISFIFGGDGATLLIPNKLKVPTIMAL